MIELSVGYYLLEIKGRVELGYTESYQSELNKVKQHLNEVVRVSQDSERSELHLRRMFFFSFFFFLFFLKLIFSLREHKLGVN
jgi:hypothetical protein